MTVKKNILYFIDILIYLCFTSYIGSFLISAFFASQEIDVILKVILVALVAIVIGACYIIGSAAQEWDLIQDFYASTKRVNGWEIVAVACGMLFSVCISVAFYGAKLRMENIGSVVFAVFIIPVVYIAGRITQDFITGMLATLFCMALPVGAFSEKKGFVFSQGEGFLASCMEGISTIDDGGIFVNILSRLESITDFSSSFPKLIMCIFFFFSIWSGLFLFISKKNGGVFLTIYFNVVIVLQIFFDFSDYFFLIIYPAAALTAGMGISFFVHKWIFSEDPEEGYDDATVSSFENFQIVGSEEEELKKKWEETGESELKKQEKTGQEQETKERTEEPASERKTAEKPEESEELSENDPSVEIMSQQEDFMTETSDAEAEISVASVDAKETCPPMEELTSRRSYEKSDKNPTELITEQEEETTLEETALEETGSEAIPERAISEECMKEEDEVSEKPVEPEEVDTGEVIEQETTIEESDEAVENDAKVDNLTEILEEISANEEENTMLDDESKLLEQEETLLFASKEQDEEETAFFEELATSARETENLREQVAQAEEELTELTEKYQKQKTQLKELIHLLEQAKERQKKDSEEITTGKQKIVTLESEIQDLNRDIEEKNVLVKEYRDRSNKTEELMNSKLAEAEKQKADMQSEFEHQKDVFQKEAEEQRSALSGELEAQRVETDKYRRTSEEHRAEAEKYRLAAEENRLEAEELRKEAETARLEMESIRAENVRYKEDAENFRKKSEEYHQENTVLLGKIDELREKLEISERNGSKDELERLKAEKEHLETDYRSRIAELQEEKTVLERKYKEELQKRKELLRRAKEEISKARSQAARR